MRQELGLIDDRPLVLVTPGGGEDGYQLVATTLQSLASLPLRDCPRTHIVCGPEMNAEQRAHVHRSVLSMPNVSAQDFSDDMMSLMGAADVVLAMGGYNTVCELLTLRKRAVLVPRMKPGVEQLIRAERMSTLGFVRMVHPHSLTPDSLLAALECELAAWQAHRSPPPLRRLDGLARVTEALFATMGHRAPAARRVEQIDWNPATSTHATQAHARAVEEQRAA